MATGNAAAVGLRLKAALVLRERTIGELGKALEISPATAGRTVQGRRQLRDAELIAAARWLEVPEWFLRGGFEEAPAGANGAEQFARGLDRKLDVEVIPRLDALANDVRELTRGARARSTASE